MNNFKISKITKFNILSLDQSYLKERLWKVTRFLFLYGVSVFLWGTSFNMDFHYDNWGSH